MINDGFKVMAASVANTRTAVFMCLGQLDLNEKKSQNISAGSSQSQQFDYNDK